MTNSTDKRMDNMIMPPPCKKLRANDLSYVSPSQGTVFLTQEQGEEAILNEVDEDFQSHQQQPVHESLIDAPPDKHDTTHHTYDGSSYSRHIVPESTSSSCSQSNKNSNNNDNEILSTGTGTRTTSCCREATQSHYQNHNHHHPYHATAAAATTNTGCSVPCQHTASHNDDDAGIDSSTANGNSQHRKGDAATTSTTTSSITTKSTTVDSSTSNTPPVQTTVTTTRFDDIIGHGAVKVRMDELLLPLALPPAWTNSLLRGVRALPASLLLYGPPGCGKTQLARALAGESQAAFLSIRPSDVLSKFVGESESAIRNLFQRAHELARGVDSQCSVLFFDEVDALGCARGGGGGGGGASEGDGSRRILAELLIQMSNLSTSSQEQISSTSRDEGGRSDDDEDCVDAANVDGEEQQESTNANSPRVRVLVVAATNRMDDCDPALIRRFAIQIHVGLPKVRDRRKIFKKFLTDDIDHILTKRNLRDLAQMTEGWSGSDLESLTREAAMTPIRECLQLAASTKRKMRKMEQQHREQVTAESSRQEGGESPQVGARNVLWKEFQRLRPVDMADFETAMTFLLNECSREGNVQDCDIYDDSSSSDSEDDDPIH